MRHGITALKNVVAKNDQSDNRAAEMKRSARQDRQTQPDRPRLSGRRKRRRRKLHLLVPAVASFTGYCRHGVTRTRHVIGLAPGARACEVTANLTRSRAFDTGS